MSNPLFIESQCQRTWLKWHRAKRRASDPVFTPNRILEGMRLGASVEVDLVVHGDRGFAVLHDLSVERETTGTGVVAQLSAAQLRSFYLRDETGAPLDQHVLLLEDLAELLLEGGLHPEALLQLDYKEDWQVLDPAAIATFKRAVAPVAQHMILSSGDAEAVRLLSESVAGLRIGYDPCHDGALERLAVSKDFTGFVQDAIAASPQAELIYLYFGLVLEADRLGFDMVGAFHAAGRRIDAYTIKTADDGALPDVLRLLDLQVDQITTDDPEGLSALVSSTRR